MDNPHMDDFGRTRLPVPILIILILTLSALAGCTTLDPSQDSGPDFTAWFLNIPNHRPTYQELGETLQLQVRNEGDAGTEQVCIEVDGAEADCGSASLVPGEETTLTFEIQPDNGTHEITVLNASATIEVEPLPRIGEWINGSLVDLRVVDAYEANETSASWNWTVEARHPDGSGRVEIHWDFGFGERGWSSDDPHTRGSWESTYIRPVRGKPVAADVRVTDPVDEDGSASYEVDEGLFRWRWPDEARTSYP